MPEVTPEAAVPGTIVASGVLISPSGDQGPIGQTGSQGPAGPTAVSADAGNIATLGTDNLILMPQQTIWNQSLRSFNALGNPNCEIDQRNVGATVTNIGQNAFIQDRWFWGKPSNATWNAQPMLAPAAGNEPLWPGTNFTISRSYLRIVLTAQQANLGGNDLISITQSVEGPRWRELMHDVHSLQILCRSTVASLKFAIALRDFQGGTTQSLVKACTTSATANAWTLIQLPNLPVWPSGNFTYQPGQEGYRLNICLGAASVFIGATDVWQSFNLLGYAGMDNFASKPVSSTFDLAFIQHQPGNACTAPIDLSFDDNLWACQRYFNKSYDYATAIGAITNNGCNRMVFPINTTIPIGKIKFPRTMAKVPTVTIYNPSNGAANSCSAIGVNTAVNSVGEIGQESFGSITIPSAVGPGGTLFHHVADTGF